MKEIAQTLSETVDKFLTESASGVDWLKKVGTGKWTNKEIMGHLTDSAQINLQRFVRCTYEEKFKLIYDQEKWVHAQLHNDADITNLLTLWELLNRQICRVLNSYPSDRIHITCDTGRHEQSLTSVEFIAVDYIGHLRHHLLQLS
jgi:hypothetical protein